MRPGGHVRHLAFGDIGHVKCAMGPKQSLEAVLFGLKSPCLGGIGTPFLASNVAQVTVIYGWHGSYGSMKPEGHVRSLDLVMGAVPSAQYGSETILSLRGCFL